MNIKAYLILIITMFLVTSCVTKKVSTIEKNTEQETETDYLTSIFQKLISATIVHIDQSQRIATIRSKNLLEDNYYITVSKLTKKENSVIKFSSSINESLYIFDILEGSPQISDELNNVSAKRSKELDEYYTEATID